MKKISHLVLSKALKRDEMRIVSGGCGSGPGLHKCCWSGTNNCSTCNSYHSCVSGAVLRDC